MSDDDQFAIRLRRLRYRAGHRGLRELDLLLGGFVEAHGAGLDERELADFEALLDVPDQTVLGWFLDEARPDPAHDTNLWARLRAFRTR